MSTSTPSRKGLGFWPIIKAGRWGIGPDAHLVAHYGPDAVLSINAEVSAFGDSTGQDPHFSVTCDVRGPGRTESKRERAGGCLHDEALRYWPELAPVVALHLSSAKNGQPMHGVANGWHWLAKASGIPERYEPDQSPEECLRVFADHVRRSVDEARSISQRLDVETEKTRRGDCETCEGSKLSPAGPACPTCGGSGEESRRHFAHRRWREEYADMLPRFAREAADGLRFLWLNATPSDQREEWRARCLEVLGVDPAL